jgi:hypothetical protein
MGKTLVNKHTDEIEKILDGSMFNPNKDYALGEIVILNAERPSIYVMTENGPMPISGNGGSGEGGDVDQEIIDNLRIELTKGYTVADDKVKNELKGEISDANTILKSELELTLAQTEAGLIEADNEIRQEVEDAKTLSASYTVNNIPISNNPFLTGSDISVGNYSETSVKDEPFENIVSDDLIKTAIKKVETMVFANALAMSASLNGLSSQIILTPMDVENNNVVEPLPYTITKIEGEIRDLTIILPDEATEQHISHRKLIFKTSTEVGQVTLSPRITMMNIQLSEIEPNTTYMLELHHNCAIWTKMYTI